MRVMPVAAAKAVQPDNASRVRVLYSATQTVVGANGRYGAWLYVPGTATPGRVDLTA